MTTELAVGVCGCGYLLYPLYDAIGNRVGVTHATYEEDDHHTSYFSGFEVSLPPATKEEP